MGANYNPSDPGTKPFGNLNILLKLCTLRCFEISFVGMREIRRLKNVRRNDIDVSGEENSRWIVAVYLSRRRLCMFNLLIQRVECYLVNE